MNSSPWSQEAYEASVTSRVWWFTIYDDGWKEAQADAEVRAILEMEQALAPLPDWARQLVEGPLRYIGPCGHYAFPLSFLDAVSAIGAESAGGFRHSCYTVGRERKARAADYLTCLDAWLAGASPERAAHEVATVGAPTVDWSAVCRDLWAVLGERTEMKELLVERTLHRQRWWLKSCTWDDDARDVWARDQFLGDATVTKDSYGNPQFGDPYFEEFRSRRVEQIEARLAELCPDWPWFRTIITDSWLCAPKAFRFLERVLWSIGQERHAVSLPSHRLEQAEDVPDFLRCEDTWPDPDVANAWWRAFLAALRGWWQDEPTTGAVADDLSQRLGPPTPVKRWLVRLFLRRCELLEQTAGHFDRLFTPKEGVRRGRGALRMEA